MTKQIRYWVSAMFLVGASIAATNCGGESNAPVIQPPAPGTTGAPGASPASPAAPTSVTINITEVFINQPIIVRQETIVAQNVVQNIVIIIIINNGDVEHTMTADDGSFDTGAIPPGGSVTIIIREPGDHPFHCRFHSNEHGIMRVEPPSPTRSVTPTITPTVTPTITPSVTPTETPSATPTITPTPLVPSSSPSPSPSQTQAEVTLTATLNGSQEVPPVQSTGTGSASVQVVNGQEIQYKLSELGLENITGATIQLGAEGSNGPVLFVLSRGAFTGSINGTLKASDLDPAAGVSFGDAVNALANGNTYVNVLTTQNPGGEIRGQLKP